MLLPLWAGYLVKGYAWKSMLRPASEFGVDTGGGFLASVFGWTPGFGWTAVILSLSYLWLPYMVLPIYAGLERLPPSLLDASGDLGARPLRTFRSVIDADARAVDRRRIDLHVLAVARRLHHPEHRHRGEGPPRSATSSRARCSAPNQPLAAAFTLWPLLIIVVYLVGHEAARRVREPVIR